MTTYESVQKTIADYADALPEKNITTMMLQGLDFVVPGEWQNLRGFDETIRVVAGVEDPAAIQAIRQKALALYQDPANNYQKAMTIFQVVDKADVALGAAALANKLGEHIQLFSLINKFTPKADTTQMIDLAVKLGAEAVCFSLLRGLKHDSFGDFASALGSYSAASKMRLAALVCVDGIVPLGPDFMVGVSDQMRRLRPAELLANPVFSRVGKFIPGNNSAAQLGFLQGAVDSSKQTINHFVGQRGLTKAKVLGGIGKFVALTDDVLDYVGGFLDASTNYFEHTGVQTISREVIERAL